jgi:hypothetical protein
VDNDDGQAGELTQVRGSRRHPPPPQLCVCL